MPGILSDNAEQQIATGLAKLSRLAPGVTPGPRKRHVRPSRAHCVLDEDLDAGLGLESDPSTATATLVRRGSDGQFREALHENTGLAIKINVVNFSPAVSLQAAPDHIIAIHAIGENEWEPVVGGTAGGIFARGNIVNADCEDGTYEIDLTHMSFCGEPPDSYDGIITAVDPIGILSLNTKEDLENGDGAMVGAKYMYALGDDCAAAWEIEWGPGPVGCNQPSTGSGEGE